MLIAIWMVFLGCLALVLLPPRLWPTPYDEVGEVLGPKPMDDAEYNEIMAAQDLMHGQ